MKTMFVKGTACADLLACRIWLTISAEVKLRVHPPIPLAQKRQPNLQPAWVDTHTVVRSAVGIRTVSTFSRSPRVKRNFLVLSVDLASVTKDCGKNTKSSCKRWRKGAGRFFISAKLSTHFLYSQSKICAARKAGSPILWRYCVSSAWDKPRMSDLIIFLKVTESQRHNVTRRFMLYMWHCDLMTLRHVSIFRELTDLAEFFIT